MQHATHFNSEFTQWLWHEQSSNLSDYWTFLTRDNDCVAFRNVSVDEYHVNCGAETGQCLHLEQQMQ